MEINRAAFGVVAAACIAAAGGGAYLASRPTVEPPPAVTAPADAGTEASEGIVMPSAPVASPVEAPRAQPAPVPARQASRRSAPAIASRERARDLRPAEPERVPAPAPEAPGPVQLTEVAPVAPPPAPVTMPPPAPPEPAYEELVVAASQVIGLQVDTTVSSETARIEDKVDARVTRDVKVGDRVAIPAGAKALGSVTVVDRGGKMKGRARLGVRFHTIVLADGMRVPFHSDAVFREGDSPTTESSAKIGGGAIGGAIIGGILGGARGAILGSTAGAGAGTAAVMAGGRNPAVLRTGETVTVRLMQPVTVTVEK